MERVYKEEKCNFNAILLAWIYFTPGASLYVCVSDKYESAKLL